LPPELQGEDNQRIAAEYIVNRFGEAEGFVFALKQSYSLSKRAKGAAHSAFNNATVYDFSCSQNRQRRNSKTSILPYGKMRNRRAQVELFDCQGSIKVAFLAKSEGTKFDISIDFKHNPHPGRPQFGLPVKIRRWIAENPRPTVTAQREELHHALAAGKIEGLTDDWYNPALIHYWWRKEVGRKTYISDDPWVNMEHILKQDPKVNDQWFYIDDR
jgi:hypothetical protein